MKYQISRKTGCKVIRIRKSEFVAKTQFFYLQSRLLYLFILGSSMDIYLLCIRPIKKNQQVLYCYNMQSNGLSYTKELMIIIKFAKFVKKKHIWIYMPCAIKYVHSDQSLKY